MSHYIRSIRGIERSQAYAPISPVNRYASYRNREQIEPSRAEPVPGFDYREIEAQTAMGAAAWLRTAKSAEGELNGLMIELGRLEGWKDSSVTKDMLLRLEHILNELASVYSRYEEQLKPEVWEVIELALRHPAAPAIGLARGEVSAFRIEADKAEAIGRLATEQDRTKLRRLLLGSEGLLNGLKHAVAYAEKQRQTSDWLHLPFTAAYPYALYYGAAQLYWPLPSRGSILNKFI